MRVTRRGGVWTGAVLAVALLGAPGEGAAQSQMQGAPVASDEAYVGGPGSANYELASRWAPYRIEDLVYSTMIRPRWIEGSDRFWYEWETSEGTFHTLVDMARGEKRLIFDRDRIAAQLTEITGDPYDAQNLPIRKIRFLDGRGARGAAGGGAAVRVRSSEEEGPLLRVRRGYPPTPGARGLRGAGQSSGLGERLPGREHGGLRPEPRSPHDVGGGLPAYFGRPSGEERGRGR